MLKKIVTTTGKIIYKKLPKHLQKKMFTTAAPYVYKLRTKGITPDSKMVEWAHKNKRSVSIVIPSYNDYAFLKACVESIHATCSQVDYEIIIVDDYCKDENRELLRSLEDSTTRVIFRDKNGGFAKAVNTGMRDAKYDIILLNSDIVAQPGWLEALQFSAYAIDDKVGLVSPKLVYPDGRIQYGGTYYARVLAPQWFGHLYVGKSGNDRVANIPTYNRSISGACVYITRKAFDELSTLDETFWLGFEDVDYGLRAWERGIRCYYQPASMLIHHESATRGYSQGKRELASMRYFWSRWESLFMTRDIASNKPDVDYVISDASTKLWNEYVVEQAASLSAQNYTVKIHNVPAESKDEKLISQLSPRNSVKICADWGAQQTVWLSSLNQGKPVYLLPSIESGMYPEDPDKQARIIANYRPEFDFIAPNRWTADQLRRESAWETSNRVVPALKPMKLGNKKTNIICAVDASIEQKRTMKSIANELGASVVYVVGAELSKATLKDMHAQNFRAIVSFAPSNNSLIDLSLMALGGALIVTDNDKTRYEVLDGYNALFAASGNDNTLKQCLEDIFTDDNVWNELRANGHKTASRFAEINAMQLIGSIEMIVRTAV